jgi:hypothetical protein
MNNDPMSRFAPQAVPQRNPVAAQMPNPQGKNVIHANDIAAKYQNATKYLVRNKVPPKNFDQYEGSVHAAFDQNRVQF